MASVWKHPHSPFYTGKYRDEKNRWRRYSTKERKQTLALRLVLKREELARLGREHRLSEEAFVKECERGRRLLFGDHDLQSARSFFTACLKSKTLAKAESTGRRYTGTVKRFLDFLGPRADEPLTTIEPRELQAFHDHLLTLKLAPATLIVEIKTIRTVFNLARRQRLITFNPAEAVELPQRIEQTKRRVFTPEQVEILLREADTEWQSVIHFGYYAGMRIGDAKSRDWDNVDFTAHKISFRVGKTGEELSIPMHPGLEEHLAAIAGDAAGPICPELSLRPVGGRNGLSQEFIKLMRRAGLSSESQATGGHRKLATLSFHSLRKTFNSDLHNKGVSQEIRMKLTGHKSPDVNRTYTQTELATLRDAVKRQTKLQKPSGAQLPLGL